MTERPAQIDVVVFDMGGVIVKLAPLAEVLAGVDLPSDELWERWILSDSVKRFESGACTLDEFADGLIAELGVTLTPSALLDRFRQFPQGLFDGARILLDDVRSRCPIAILSNTNELHWTTQPDNDYLRTAFDHEYLSYELGFVKPGRAIFDHVVADLGVPASRVLFLDDNQVNVDGARAAGLRSELATGPGEARAALVASGVLS